MPDSDDGDSNDNGYMVINTFIDNQRLYFCATEPAHRLSLPIISVMKIDFCTVLQRFEKSPLIQPPTNNHLEEGNMTSVIFVVFSK